VIDDAQVSGAGAGDDGSAGGSDPEDSGALGLEMAEGLRNK